MSGGRASHSSPKNHTRSPRRRNCSSSLLSMEFQKAFYRGLVWWVRFHHQPGTQWWYVLKVNVILKEVHPMMMMHEGKDVWLQDFLNVMLEPSISCQSWRGLQRFLPILSCKNAFMQFWLYHSPVQHHKCCFPFAPETELGGTRHMKGFFPIVEISIVVMYVPSRANLDGFLRRGWDLATVNLPSGDLYAAF